MGVDISDIRIVYPKTFWVIQDGHIKIVAPVQIYGIDLYGFCIYDQRIRVDIPVGHVKWESLPLTIQYKQVYGIAHVSVLKKAFNEDVRPMDTHEETLL